MTNASQLVAAARSEIGYLENPPGSNKTKFAKEAGHPNGAAWCLTAVVALLKRCKIRVSRGVLETAYTPTAAYAFERDGRWIEPIDIEPGDIVFFDFPDAKDRVQHVGIATEPVRRSILRLGRRVVVCAEGNTSSGNRGSQDNGGGFFERTRPLAHAVGAGRPYFTDPEDDMTPEQDAKLNATHMLASAAFEATKRIEAQLAEMRKPAKPAKTPVKASAR